jgi:hypothetical protein
MVRAQHKDKEYFDEFIDFEKYVIDDFNNELKLDNDAAKESRLKAKICTSSYHLIIAMYSRGDSLTEIREFFSNNYVQDFCLGWEHHISGPGPDNIPGVDTYYQALITLSLAILLNTEAPSFSRLVNVLDRTMKSDFLLDYMINYKEHGRKLSDEVHYKSNFGDAVKAIKCGSKNEAETILKSRLDKSWYKSFKHSYWYETHDHQHDVYFGYWSFDTAVIVKMLNLNEEVFKGQPYYPFGFQ